MASTHPADVTNSDTAQQVPGSKRRRVAKACLSCRLHKSKCDGRRPVCSRCRDYEHACTWSGSKIDHFKLSTGAQEHESPASTLDGLQSGPTTENEYLFRQAIHSYDDLLDAIQYNLPEADRAIIASTVSSIRQRLPNITASGKPARNSITPVFPEAVSPLSPGRLRAARQRYLGEASELRFYHSVKRVLRDDQASDGAPGTHMDSYDQEDHFTEGDERLAPNPPPRQLADKYIDIYFSTIHIAYPFLCKPVFMTNYEKFWSGDINFIRDDSWIPLLYTVFALGAYYTSFPRSKDEVSQNYSQYFKYASALAAPVMTDCTLENIQILLSQCVFLLATSQTDRCWTLLGLAIRIAQTIGLHVEDSHKRSMTNPTLLEAETMRRVWYTMYNMDRLLALQLGRPIAIHNDDYSVQLPSKAEDNHFNTNTEELSPPVNGGPSSVDFFICVIRFSGVLGQVVRDLYRPSQLQPDPDSMLDNIANLDANLLNWKNSLPRHLRFDLGHVFENCIVFKRQRNMLAIKFHHLRALIHRPYLCLSRLQRNNALLMDLLRRFPDRVQYMERTCVFEAQQTAHLLNNVSNTGNLVHDFPWWQMIPCLLCASSILLVASAYTETNQLDVGRDTDELREDAETCLKVFDALSVNSNAARRARDMLESLEPSRIQPRSLSLRGNDSSTTDNGIDVSSGSTTLLSRNATQSGSISSTQQPINHEVYSLGSNNNLEDQSVWDMRSAAAQDYGSWPLELSDTMNWSAQFLDPGFLLRPLAAPILALGDMHDGRTGDVMHGDGSGGG